MRLDHLWPTRTIIVCPFFYTADAERAAITRRIFKWYQDLPFMFIGVGSEGATSAGIFRETFGAADRYVEYAQDFDCSTLRVPGAGCEGLRRKFDFAIQQAKQYDPERVFITGSDDLVPRELYLHGPASQADLVGIGGATHLWRQGTRGYGRLTSSGFPGTELVGGPLGFSRAYLDGCSWAPFALPNCEVGAERLVRQQGGTVEAFPLTFWQVKSSAVLNPIGHFAHRWEWHDEDEELRRFLRQWDALRVAVRPTD